MLRVISVNLNGIRSAAKKGFFVWIAEQNADIICVQEIKAQFPILANAELQLTGYESYFFEAEKKGYSGVGIYTRHKPLQVLRGLGWEHADNEGRYIQIDFPKLSIASVYLPSGSSGEHRQTIKFDFLARYGQHLKTLTGSGKEFILCGDWNIAHKQIDIKNWRSNQKNSGFLPEERAWMDDLFGAMGFIDAFRVVNQEADQYTWWSNRGQARIKNVGWRIDYQVVTSGLQKTVKNVAIYTQQYFSDHAPLIVDYNVDF